MSLQNRMSQNPFTSLKNQKTPFESNSESHSALHIKSEKPSFSNNTQSILHKQALQSQHQVLQKNGVSESLNNKLPFRQCIKSIQQNKVYKNRQTNSQQNSKPQSKSRKDAKLHKAIISLQNEEKIKIGVRKQEGTNQQTLFYTDKNMSQLQQEKIITEIANQIRLDNLQSNVKADPPPSRQQQRQFFSNIRESLSEVQASPNVHQQKMKLLEKNLPLQTKAQSLSPQRLHFNSQDKQVIPENSLQKCLLQKGTVTIKLQQTRKQECLDNQIQNQALTGQLRSLRQTIKDLRLQKIKTKAEIDSLIQNQQNFSHRDKKSLTHPTRLYLVNELSPLQTQHPNKNVKRYLGRIVKNKIFNEDLLVQKPSQNFYSTSNTIQPPQNSLQLTQCDTKNSEKMIYKLLTNQKKFKSFVNREKTKSAKKFQKSFLRTVSVSLRQTSDKETFQKPFQGTIIRNIPKILSKSQEIFFSTSLQAKFFDLKVMEAIKAAQKKNLSKRAISLPQLTIPDIPDPPTYSSPLQSLVQSIFKVLLLGNIAITRDQFEGCSLKKYRNCIMFSLPNNDRIKVVWHFSGKLYLGEWNKQTNEKAGFGVQIIPHKQYYKGEFSSGKKYGKGIYLKAEGQVYEGEFINGLKHGKGKYLDSKQGSYYEGEWNNDKMSGFGYLQIGDNIFEGTLKSGIKQGFGVQHFENGDKYIGQFNNDKFHGQGKYVWSNGSSYLGHFREGNREGFGKWVSEQQHNETYLGFYTNDKKQGTGKYIWKNGCIYEGNFQNDKKEGIGNIQYPDGRSVQGIWTDGVLTKVISKINDAHANQPLEGKRFKKKKKNTLNPK